MNQKISFYIPTSAPVNQLLIDGAIENVKRFMSSSFGGYTCQNVMGGWVSPNDGSFIEEPILIVYSWTTDIPQDIESAIRALAAQLALELKQENIGIELGSNFILV